MLQSGPNSAAESPAGGILEIGVLVLRYRIMSLLIVLTCAAIALIATAFVHPRYRSEAVLKAIDQNIGESGLAAMVGRLGSVAQLAGLGAEAGNSADDAVATLESWSLAQAFIEQQGLLGELSKDSGYSWLGGGHKNLSMQRAVRHFRNRILSVHKDRTSNLVTVSIVWTDPVQAAAWVNQYVSMADGLMRRRALVESERSLAFLRKEFEGTAEVALRDAVASLVETEMKRRMFAQARSEFSLQVLDAGHAPDPRDNIYPRRAWILLAALICGCVLAGTVAVFRARTASTAH
jgi:uncharacterized protein involved in exopolysaccharide biosynthesis